MQASYFSFVYLAVLHFTFIFEGYFERHEIFLSFVYFQQFKDDIPSFGAVITTEKSVVGNYCCFECNMPFL
jgi:hypothetical protein